MAYFLDLFSPETYEAFKRSDQSVSGFRVRQQGLAAKVKPGDRLVCYMTKLSRWVGLLEVQEGPYIDDTPIFYPEDDPCVVRFQVKPVAWLEVEKAIPIHEDRVWNTLSFTRGHDKGSSIWTGKVRSSLVQLSEADGRFLERAILAQQEGGGETYPVDQDEYRRLSTHRVRRADGVVTVSSPKWVTGWA